MTGQKSIHKTAVFAKIDGNGGFFVQNDEKFFSV